jgi:hypothetical protein
MSTGDEAGWIVVDFLIHKPTGKYSGCRMTESAMGL